jgi:XTP/dITP diphosphohydrolase
LHNSNIFRTFAGFYIIAKKMKLVFASNNKHELDEVRKILPSDICVVGLAELGFHAEIDETGETLEENSALKAKTIWTWIAQQQLTHEVDGVFADDTGLEIRALGGAPGVRTARWAGEDCNDASNRQKALQELSGITDREARFRTVITLITQQGTQQVEGIVNGRISEAEEGNGGFGYDPVFIPEGYAQTFANLPTEVKNSISHRARAMEAMRKELRVES